MAKAIATRGDESNPGGASAPDDIAWLASDREYALGIDGGKLVCRNPQGKRLAAVPKWLKETEMAEQLLAMCEWLADHRTECLRRIEMWMLRSLPVPCEVVQSVWPDADWSDMLRNLVVTPVDAKGKTNGSQTGLLRDIDPKKGVGVVDRDGETQWLKAAQILIPHPILIDGLQDIREISADMGFSQAVEQLFRPVFAATDEQQELLRIADFGGGKFEQLNFATSHCRRLGYPVRGGYACSKIWENATPIEARYWFGDEYPESETYTGDLIFVDSEQTPQKISQVGPVTFSEGMRMASQIYAKRQVEKEEGDDE
jgi:hypothetical protein